MLIVLDLYVKFYKDLSGGYAGIQFTNSFAYEKYQSFCRYNVRLHFVYLYMYFTVCEEKISIFYIKLITVRKMYIIIVLIYLETDNYYQEKHFNLT